MNFRDWYTDTMDIWRIVPDMVGGLTRQERVQVQEAVPCRLYHTGGGGIHMEQTAASLKQEDWVQCDNSVDVRPGDELILHRGAGLGYDIPDIRAFAGEPNHYFEPFGAILPGIAHQEIKLMQEDRVK